VVTGDRESALAAETVRVVARRGPTSIVRTRHGLTMAAAGIDASNVEAGHVVLLPLDPDGSARILRARLREATGLDVAVVVTDSAGRAWREGQTDIAIGAAGIPVAIDHRGLVDAYGHELAVTAPAVADEIAGAAELVQGKLGGRPFAVVRGLGAREAVARALAGRPEDRVGFGAPATTEEVVCLLARVLGDGARVDVPGPDLVEVDDDPRVAPLLFACGWGTDARESGVRRRWHPAVP